jgi:putative acyl-CoA dehydrogenase
MQNSDRKLLSVALGAAGERFNQSPVFEDVNLFATDRGLAEATAREGAAWAWDDLHAVGELAGSAHVLDLGRLANENPPKLRAIDQKGTRRDSVEFHPAYHELMALSMRHGLHIGAWDEAALGKPPRLGAHVARGAKLYMISQAEAGHMCPITMTHASFATLRLGNGLLERLLPQLLSRQYDPAFAPMDRKASITIGMGMTEKQGGTDVRANTTEAEPLGSGGLHAITGHKWFMSAPMCDAFLILAQAPKGLSCFLLPRFRADGRLNAIRIERLKDKLGNRSNASSEVTFLEVEAQLVGEEGRGVPAIIEMVTQTRLDCALSSAGLMRFALANALRHTRHRTVFQRKLIDQPLMANVLADLALDAEAATALAFRLAGSFDRAQDQDEAAYRRLMTPVIKYWVCKAAPPFVYEAMECMGGNGYVEEGLLARAYREAPLNAIWEGSGNVMCLDILRVMQREPDAVGAVLASMQAAASSNRHIATALDELKAQFTARSLQEADGRWMAERLALLAAATLLVAHAPAEIAEPFAATRLAGGWRHSYGAGLRGANCETILTRAGEGL